jgi:hypothetical protein
MLSRSSRSGEGLGRPLRHVSMPVHLIAIDELELRESQNPVPVEGGLEREVEAGERLEG